MPDSRPAGDITDIHGDAARLAALLDLGSNVFTVIDGDGWIVFHHVPSVGVVRLHRPVMAGRNVLDIILPEDVGIMRQMISACLADPALTQRCEYRIADPNRGIRTFHVIAHRLPTGLGFGGDLLLVSYEITERRALEEQLARHALTDSLTGLPNRAVFMDRLAFALTRFRVSGAPVSVLIINPRALRLVNDRLGFRAGDRVLVVTAERLVRLVGPDQTVARLNSNEFAVLLDGWRMDAAEGPITLASRIVDALAEPIEVDDGAVRIGFRVGAASTPTGGTRPEDLLRSADLALGTLAGNAQASVSLFDPSMRQGELERRQIEADLPGAGERGELRLAWQPVFTLDTGRLVAVEALVRWQHPVYGLIGPDRFIPVAERSGTIRELGQWVLRAACRVVRGWQQGLPAHAGLLVAVNVSPGQIRDHVLVHEVRDALSASGLDPRSLCVEITESTMMHDEDEAVEVLSRLRDLGVGIALDDFGTGYSSLATLGRLPLDTLKIDRSFVRRLDLASGGIELIRMIVGLARQLGLCVTVEGIETEDELARLRPLGLDGAQGFLFSPPLDEDRMSAFLAATPVTPVIARAPESVQRRRHWRADTAAGTSHASGGERT